MPSKNLVPASSLDGWIRSTYMPTDMTAKLMDFLLSDDEDNCKIPAEKRKEMYAKYVRLGIFPSVTTRRKKLSLDAIPISLRIAGVTLRTLLAKIGQNLELDNDLDKEVYTLLSRIPQNHPLLSVFRKQTSLLTEDLWYLNELKQAVYNVRFYFVRQKYPSNVYERVDVICADTVPYYTEMIENRHFSNTIDCAYFPFLCQTWHISPRWLYALPDGCCAFLEDEDADVALSNFMCMNERSRKVALMALKKGMYAYGLR